MSKLIQCVAMLIVIGTFIIGGNFDRKKTILLPFFIFENGIEKHGYINEKGETIIRPKFSGAKNFSEGLAAIEIKNKWGYIDKKGTFVIKPKFDHAYNFSEGLANVEIKGKHGFINRSGEIVIHTEFDLVYEDFCEGYAIVLLEFNGKKNYIDKNGNFFMKNQFDDILPFSEGLAPVKKSKKWGFINKAGMWVIKPKYDLAQSFSEGLASVRLSKKAGYINKNGNVVIEFLFEGALEFSEGLASVFIGEKCGYINRKGEIVIQPQFLLGSYFNNGRAVCDLYDNSSVIINKQGKRISEKLYDGWGQYKNGIANIGYTTLHNPPQYEFGYVDREGNVIWSTHDFEVLSLDNKKSYKNPF